MKCIGYGKTKGRCDNFITHPNRGTYWCDNCNKVRIETITKQFKTIADEFPKGKK